MTCENFKVTIQNKNKYNFILKIMRLKKIVNYQGKKKVKRDQRKIIIEYSHSTINVLFLSSHIIVDFTN